MLTEVFWVSFVSTVTGMIIALARICYKSKCRQVDICCVHVFRDTALEVQEEANRVDHLSAGGTSPSSPQASSTPFSRLRQLGNRSESQKDLSVVSTKSIGNEYEV